MSGHLDGLHRCGFKIAGMMFLIDWLRLDRTSLVWVGLEVSDGLVVLRGPLYVDTYILLNTGRRDARFQVARCAM